MRWLHKRKAELERVNEEIARVEEQQPRIDDLSANLERESRVNSFSLSIKEAMRGTP